MAKGKIKTFHGNYNNKIQVLNPNNRFVKSRNCFQIHCKAQTYTTQFFRKEESIFYNKPRFYNPNNRFYKLQKKCKKNDIICKTGSQRE